MKNLLLYLCIAFTISNTSKAHELHTTVVPIQWQKFKPVKPSKPYLLSSQIVANAARYSNEWAKNTYDLSLNKDQYLIENKNSEWAIRPSASAAYGLAVAIKTQVDTNQIGTNYTELTENATRLIKGLVAVHKSNGGNWGDHWQSTLWSALVGRAGWMLWDEIDEESKEMLCRMLVHEADRFIHPDYRIKYWNGIGGDSKAEELSWDSMPLQLAIAMMPQHANVERWKTICSKMLVSAYAVEADMSNAAITLDGKTPQEWISGYNVREDGIVINHGLLHNDYMASIAHLQMSGFHVFSLANQTVPQALDFNFRFIYQTLTTKQFTAPPFKSPGGTMYIPNSPEQYYPEGTDWSKHRYACYYGLDALADVLKYDKKLPKAADWVSLRANRIIEFQSRHADGHMYQSGEYDNYKGVEQMIFWMCADAHLLYWLADRKAIAKKESWLQL